MRVMTLFKKTAEEENGVAGFMTSCAVGEVIPVEKIRDSVFSSKILGEGFGVIPDADNVCSPVSGTVKDITNNGLAINIKTADGLLILVHIGMNLSKRKDSGVRPTVSVGDEIAAGQTICTADFSGIAADGYDPTIAVIITNSDIFRSFKLKTGKINKPGTPVMTYTL